MDILVEFFLCLLLLCARVLEVLVEYRQGLEVLACLLVERVNLIVRLLTRLIRLPQAPFLSVQLVSDAPQIVRADFEILVLFFGFLAPSLWLLSKVASPLDAFCDAPTSAEDELTGPSSLSLSYFVFQLV